jgi:D-3-phosphoglycerate dehydrogenase
VTAAEMIVDYFASGKLHSPVNAVILDPEVRESLEPFGQLARRLGILQAQLCDTNPERLVVKFFGKSFDEKTQSYLASSVLEGFLRHSSATPVNRINARTIARDQGLAIEERSEGPSKYFVDLIKVEVSCEGCGRELGGAIRGRRGLRLVSLDAYHFDAVLEGILLFVANVDRPGMIGVLGQTLASHDINISSMSLGRDQSGGTAISVTNIDGPECPKAVVEDLARQDGILWVRAVSVE